jgi:hypothetical protein
MLIESIGLFYINVSSYTDSDMCNMEKGETTRLRSPWEVLVVRFVLEANPLDFKRFPLWMWRNRVVVDFIEWLRGHNDQFGNDMNKKVAFYGMDLYSFYSSMDAVIEYLEKVSPEDAKVARRRYSNFDRFQGEPAAYGQAAGFGLSNIFEKEGKLNDNAIN